MNLFKDHVQYKIRQELRVVPLKLQEFNNIQRVPINIVHGEINDYLKSQSDYQVKFHSILKPMVLFIIGENSRTSINANQRYH